MVKSTDNWDVTKNIIGYKTDWQIPAATEKHAYDKIREYSKEFINTYYIGFPWATLFDLIDCKKGTRAKQMFNDLQMLLPLPSNVRVISVVQHILLEKHIELLKSVGVTDIFWCHARVGIDTIDGIRIHAFPIYPVQVPVFGCSQKQLNERKFLASFIGLVKHRLYKNSVREWIHLLNNEEKFYIKGRDEWHYEYSVYQKSVRGEGRDVLLERERHFQEIEYRSVMAESVFCLCPSGTGPNSIRLWECLEYNCIPVILSDQLKLPGDHEKWKEGVIFIDECEADIAELPELLSRISNDKIKLRKMQKALEELKMSYGKESFVTDIEKLNRDMKYSKLNEIKVGLEKSFRLKEEGKLVDAIGVLEKLNPTSIQLSDNISFFSTLYKKKLKVSEENTFDYRAKQRVSENDESKGMQLSIRSYMELKQFDKCFWAAAQYFRKFYANHNSLGFAEEIYSFLKTDECLDRSKKFYEDYLHAARKLNSIYSDPGILKDTNVKKYVDSYTIDLPTIQQNGNIIPAKHRNIEDNTGLSSIPVLDKIIVWGESVTLADREYWTSALKPHGKTIDLLFVSQKHGDSSSQNILMNEYSVGGLLNTIDASINTCSVSQRIAIVHVGIKLSPKLLQYFLYFNPSYNSVITPHLKLRGNKSSEIRKYIDGVNKKTKCSIQKFHDQASLLCSCFTVAPGNNLAALEAIPHLDYCSKEFFWRQENLGAYFVTPAIGYAAVGESTVNDTMLLSKSHSSRKLLCELYPLSSERKSDKAYVVPTVDIYIPMYNAEKYIEEAVLSCVNQTYKDIRICISDDGSTDKSVEIVKRLQKQYTNIDLESHDNSGISITTMKAIEMGRGLLIAQLDSDDRLIPTAIETLIFELLGNENMGCVYGSCERIDASGQFIQKEYSFPEFHRNKMLSTSICHHFRMWKRKYYNRTSHFNPFIVNGIDYDFFSKIAEVTEVKHIDKILYQRRWHGENTSIRRESDQTRNTYICILNSLNRQGLGNVHPVSPIIDEPRKIKFVVEQRKTKILRFPDYSYSNPYQNLLYQDLSNDFDVMKGDLKMALDLVEKEPLFFHLHWLNFIFSRADNDIEAAQLVNKFLADIKLFKERGGRLVWTIHNDLEHDLRFPSQDARLRAALCALSDKIHMHDISSLNEVFKNNPVPAEKLIINPHGNYIGSYGEFDVSDRIAGIRDGSRNILFVGQLRNYKGLDRVLKMLEKLSDAKFNITIAGQPEDDATKKMLESCFSSKSNVRLILERVKNEELHELLKTHEYGLLSYNSILTSGTFRLLQSYGVIPIAPDLPLFTREISDKNTGFIYKNDLSDVDEVITGLSLFGKKEMAWAADYNYHFANELNWSGDLTEYFINTQIVVGDIRSEIVSNFR